MATIGNTYPTLADVASRMDPNGKIPDIVELLAQTNEMLDDIPWIEGNLPTGHKHSVRTGLPDVAWRQLYKGVQPSKSRTVPVTDACGMLEAYAEVDKKVADLNGNTAEFRLSEDVAFLEAMSQSCQAKLFYGNTATDPEQIMGFAPRFNDLGAANAENVLDAGGTGDDNTSIWLVGWGKQTVHGLFPKGSKAGLKHEDLGQVTLDDGEGGRFEGYRSHYIWEPGLAVRDWRYVVRIANIDVSSLVKTAATGADINDLMVQAIEMLPGLKGGVLPRIYCNRTIRTMWRRQLMNKTNVYLSLDTVAGKKVLTFDEVPVRRVDQIVNTESRVV